VTPFSASLLVKRMIDILTPATPLTAPCDTGFSQYKEKLLF